MASRLPYDASADALLHPSREAVFFRGWELNGDNQRYELLCAEMSRLAYADPPVVSRALASVGFTPVGFIDLHGTQGFVAKNTVLGLTVLAFRGTQFDKFEDLISDLDTLQTDFREGSRVHAGFRKAYDVVRQQVAGLLEGQETTLLVTGHSLGAALATLAALDTHPTALITFGSPRVGDAQFIRLFNGLTVHRFVHCCDIVTRIPPEQFDHKHFVQLFTELGEHPQPWSVGRPLGIAAITDLIATALAGVFQGVASVDTFTHLSPACYIRADGTLAQGITDDQLVADQQAARATFHASVPTGLEQWLELLRSTRSAPGGLSPVRLDRVARSVVRSLFDLVRGDTVPLRDLADHAPINYVSGLTGRTPPSREREDW